MRKIQTTTSSIFINGYIRCLDDFARLLHKRELNFHNEIVIFSDAIEKVKNEMFYNIMHDIEV